jgi:catechol 2,3-dioxygenase-like lactoylglutathione lyase family enzyme
MFSHLGLNVTDLALAKKYYDDVMPLLGFEAHSVPHDQLAYRQAGRAAPVIFFQQVSAPSTYSRDSVGLQHLAFALNERAAVDAVHAAVRARGGTVLHEPRLFPEYSPNYYATFWLDPFGFMLEALCVR